MPVQSENRKMKYVAAATSLILLILFVFLYTLMCRSEQNRLDQAESRLKTMAMLEAGYLQNSLPGAFSDTGETLPPDGDRDALIQKTAAPLLERQNKDMNGNYVFALLETAQMGTHGMTCTETDTGQTWYTYYMPLGGSGFAMSVSSPEQVLLGGMNKTGHIGQLFTVSVTAIVLILFFIVLYHLRRRQKELLGANEKLRVSDEKFRIAISHTADIVFECDLKNGSIQILNDCAPGKRNLICRKQMDKESWKQMIHPADLPALTELGGRMRAGEREFSLIFRARAFYGEVDYRWYRLILTVIMDENGKPGPAVGTASDINEQQTETLKLRSRAQRDFLTGLLNREECEAQVERLLSDNRWSGGAFLLMDLDHFKSLNDNLGHITGDRALRMLASVIRQIFRETDVMGRIGGDEFMVLLRDVTEPAMVEQKLSELRQGLLLSNNGGNTLPDLQLSVGVVFAGKKDHFQDLYNMADIALYQAKNEGRNRNIFYKREEEPATCT